MGLNLLLTRFFQSLEGNEGVKNSCGDLEFSTILNIMSYILAQENLAWPGLQEQALHNTDLPRAKINAMSRVQDLQQAVTQY